MLKHLDLNGQFYQMGKPDWRSLTFLHKSFNVNLKQVVQQQLERKQAYGTKVWQNTFVINIYKTILLVSERFRFAKYLALLTKIKPEYLVVWNGKKLPNVTVVMAAKTLGIKVFYFENGLLPKTVSLDPKGVNFASSLSRDPAFYRNFDPENRYVFSAPDLVPRASIKKRNRFDAIELPKRFVFVPFQVPHDTQIVCYSSWIKSMESLYDHVISAVKALGDPELKVVFKEHPTWHKHYVTLYEKDPIAVFANGNATPELMSKSQVVITINSTVGMESLLLGKPVITLGDACYNIDGLVQHANNQHELRECLNKVSQGWQMSSRLCNKFFAYLKYVYCVPRTTKDDPEHIQAVSQRLLGEDLFSLDRGELNSVPPQPRATPASQNDLV
ncbi:capsular polysaccharide export protein, LipB/KpsS family [Marinomonas sp. TW1]|uniref:capsular polysaccharide export protein, LipB/KpsS family n=1 Tax=Marinomonas sp. TW1 TaxID=1561203 RepID=UPI0018D3528D|nr:polysaccharide synthesis/modification protein [Marinomonas sp. TW1]